MHSHCFQGDRKALEKIYLWVLQTTREDGTGCCKEARKWTARLVLDIKQYVVEEKTLMKCRNTPKLVNKMDRPRVNKKLEGDTAGTAELSQLRVVHILWHHPQQQKLWDRKKEVGDFGFQGGCCSETGWASLCFRKLVNDCLCSTSTVFPPWLHLSSGL